MSIALGDPAPSFELRSVDGAVRTLDDYAEADVLVLVQGCNHCPYVQASHDLLRAVTAEYGPKGVRLVLVNSNDAEMQPEDGFDAMVEHAREHGFTFDYLHDEEQALARALDATRTPEVFVFDRDRRLRYHGAPTSALLDHRSGEDGAADRDYLREALDAVLAGRDPEIADTPLLGCSVKSEHLELLRDPIRFVWRDASAA